jgi:phospholipase C
MEGKPGDGLAASMANPDGGGAPRAVYRESVDCVADPPHGWNPSRAQFNAGANDGFVKVYQQSHGVDIAPHPMGYFTREELPAMWALADAYTSCDRWFASVMGPTWPNRMYLHGGQSAGTQSNVLTPDGPYTFPLIYNRLLDKGVDFKYYFSDIPFLAIFNQPYVNAGYMKKLDLEFFDDAASGKLPPVTVIDPAFSANDDHPPHHPIFGQQLIAAIYAALSSGPQWKNMLFVITYDEHGGFYDHVAPPRTADDRAAAGFDQLGFRVPTLVMGPYVKAGHVSSVVHDHTSVLRHMETMFGLEPLGARDAAANDLSDTIDAARLAARDPLPAVKLPAVVVDESMIDPASCYGIHDKPTELEQAFDRGELPREWDHRRGVRELLYTVGDVLDRHDAGRIVRGR